MWYDTIEECESSYSEKPFSIMVAPPFTPISVNFHGFHTNKQIKFAKILIYC